MKHISVAYFFKKESGSGQTKGWQRTSLFSAATWLLTLWSKYVQCNGKVYPRNCNMLGANSRVVQEERAPLPGTSVYLSKKIHNWTNAVFNICKINKINPWKCFFVTFRTCEKIEVKRGHLVKKWEFSQKKKKSCISIL